MAAEGKIRIGIFGHDAGFGKSMDSAWRKADTFQKKMALVGGKMTDLGTKMTMGVTLPIVAGMALAVKSAIAEQEAMALLSKAMETNAHATDKQVAGMERWITRAQNATGIADGELRPAMAALVTVTDSGTKARHLMNLAMDISVAKGKPLAMVVSAISKAYTGNVGALGRLGIATKDFTVNSVKLQSARANLAKAEENYAKTVKDTDKTAADRAVAAARLAAAHETLKKVMSGSTGTAISFERAMRRAKDAYGGAAATAAKTTAGQMAILKARFIDAGQALGVKLIPWVEKAVKWLTKLMDWASKHETLVAWGLGIAAAAGPVMFLTGKILLLTNAILTYRATAALKGLSGLASGAASSAGSAASGAASAGAAGGIGAGVGTAIGLGVAAGLVLVLPDIITRALGRNSKAHQQFVAAGEEAGKAFATTGFAKGTQAGLILAGTDKYQRAGAAALAAKSYAPIVQKLSVQLDTASYAKFHKLYADIQNLQALAKKGIVLSLDKLGKMAPAALDSLRNTIMASLGVTKKRAEQLLNDIAGKQLNFKVAKQFGAELKKTQDTVTSQGGAIVKSLLSSGTKGGAALPAGLRTGLGPTRTAAAALKSAATTPATRIPESFKQAGRAAWQGLVAGLNAGIGPVAQMAEALANAAIVHTKGPLKVKSPSLVMYSIGLDVAKGLANGITAGEPLVTVAGRRIARLVVLTIEEAKAKNREYVNTVKSFMDGLAQTTATLFDNLVSLNQQVRDLASTIMGSIELWPQYTDVINAAGEAVKTLLLPTVDASDPTDMNSVMDANLVNMRAWVANMDKLRAAGMPKELIDQMTAMGMGGAGQVAGLAAMTADQLAKWVSGWNELQKMASDIAKTTFKGAVDAAALALSSFVDRVRILGQQLESRDLSGAGVGITVNIGTVHADTSAHAADAGSAVANAIITRLATARRATSRGTA